MSTTTLNLVMVLCMDLLRATAVEEMALSLFGIRRKVKYMYTCSHLEEGTLLNDKDVTEPN